MELDQDPYQKRYQKGSEQQEKIVMAAAGEKISWTGTGSETRRT
jgi:hypothetical protein